MTHLRTGTPQAGTRYLRALACGVVAVLLTAMTLNAGDDGAVVSLSVVPNSGRATVVIGFDGNVQLKDFTLRNPDRIVVDIQGATLGVRRRGYDGVARGGVLSVHYAQNQPNVVRVVVTLDGPRKYELVRGKGAVLLSVEGGGNFVAWRAGQTGAATAVAALVPVAPAPVPLAHDVLVTPPLASPPATKVATEVPAALPPPTPVSVSPVSFDFAADMQQQQGERLITITFDKSPITDVIAQFAAYSRRTIIPAGGIGDKTITAEIKSKPWDVAFKVVLEANGFGVMEDPNGIMIVNTLENLVARPRLETLNTVTVRFNYTAADVVAKALTGRLTRDCSGITSGTAPAGGAGAAGGAVSPLSCPVRGTVTADSLTNSVSITDAPSALEDLVRYAKTLDVRQPQVNIKAKIILVDRTQLEGMGLRYDLGSRNQHFNDLVQHSDTAGAAETANIIFLGGNTLSAIANAGAPVQAGALSLVYSAALGGFDLTSFFDAVHDANVVDVQAEPSVTTMSYRTATLTAGKQIPIRTTEQGAGGNAAGQLPQVTVQIKQVGIMLNVTPSVTNNRMIKMRVSAENSDVGPGAGESGVTFTNQKVENDLLVADGETAVMGGLTKTAVTSSRSGIPLLSDLPLLGRLFSSTSRLESKQDLLILITPHIVDEGDMTMDARKP